MPDWNGPGIGYVVYWRKKGGSEQDWEKVSDSKVLVRI